MEARPGPEKGELSCCPRKSPCPEESLNVQQDCPTDLGGSPGTALT
jgi:hypothetical protein